MTRLLPPEGFGELKCLQERAGNALYASSRAEDGRKVAIKVYAASGHRLHEEGRARHEAATLARLAGVGLPRVLEARVSQSPPLLILDAVPSQSLDEWCGPDRPVDPIPFLEVALQLTAAIDRAHRAHMIFGDVCAANIRVDGETMEACLISCEAAERFEATPAVDATPRRTRTWEDRLAYLSPERTGRMNRHYDYRSDLYSLGCVFYRMLTGFPPFAGEDELSLIHAHIARVPVPVHERRTVVPPILSLQTSKLLSKEPEERYQSASALYADLEACLCALRERGEIDSAVAIGGGEVSIAPRFSTRLHGRATEIARLQEAYQESARGSARIRLICGEIGSGKTALVDSIVRFVRERGGVVARARLDPEQAGAHAAWASAVSSLVEQILLESDASLACWRTDLLSHLGNIAGAVVELVPDLGIVLGEVPAIPPLPPAATRARLSLALQRLVTACARQEHPLLLVFEDLHVADDGSAELFDDVLAGADAGALLVLGTYQDTPRSAEDEGRPALDPRILRSCERVGSLETLHLGPLDHTTVELMLAEVLCRTRADVAMLHDVLERKTGNSPLLIRQFIAHVSERGLLRYQQGVGWTWDEGELAAADVPDEAVGLMTARLDRLAEGPRTAIGAASCIGRTFDLEVVESLVDCTTDELASSISALVSAGLIAPGRRGYRFVHGRVRDAAYKQLDIRARTDAHARIGRRLYEQLSSDERSEHLFSAVDHLNLGATSPHAFPRAQRIETNLLAASRALAAGSSPTAARYLATARKELYEDDWTEQRALAMQVMSMSISCALEQNSFDEAIALLDDLAARKPDRAEKIQLDLLRLRALPVSAPPRECVRLALEMLRDLGVRWPDRPSGFRARWALRVAGWILTARGVESMVRPPTEDLSRPTAILRILAISGPSMVLHDVRLGALATALALRLQSRYGRVTSPSYRVSTLAAFSYVLMGGSALARRRSELAFELNRRLSDPLFGPRTEYVVYALVHPFIESRRSAIAQMGRVAESVRELGDPEYFQYTRFVRALYRALIGDPIPDVAEHLRETASVSGRTRPWYVEGRECHTAYRLLEDLPDVENLAGRVDESYREIRSDANYLSTTWMMVLCFFGEYEAAFAESERVADRLYISAPFAHVCDHTFYRGLCAARLATHARGRARRRYRAALRRSHRRLRAWARGGPDFVHMTALLQAEHERLGGRTARAAGRYELAARAAEDQRFPHHAALAHESRAQILEEMRRSVEAGRARAEAARLYELWGAKKKAADLLQSA